MSLKTNLLPLNQIARPSVSEQVFDYLKVQIVTLALPPGSRISEADVAKALGTSRQPVRDAFSRLSKLGLLDIRPQRATRVSLISDNRVKDARFVRTALEVETIGVACQHVSDPDIARLRQILAHQIEAIGKDDRAQFHRLDDAFHQEICAISRHPFVWQIISENKAHLDRVRLCSLSFNQRRTLKEHEGLLAAIEERDGEKARSLMRQHLSRLEEEIDRIRAENVGYFASKSSADS
jgi:DNA-binding GntR family transcriptional regulator